MQLYSNNLSAIATISPSIKSEIFPSCFSCSKNFNLLQSSLGADEKNLIFQTPEAETLVLGDFSNFFKSAMWIRFITPSL